MTRRRNGSNAHAHARLAALTLCALLAAGTSASADEPSPTAQDSAPTFEVEGQLFGGLWWILDEPFSEFDLGRAELTTRFRPVDYAGFELTAEAVRSASAESVLGVDGDSLILRIKRAWAHGGFTAGPVDLEARAGLIPEPWIEALEQGYDFRGLSPLLAERGHFFDTSDLGAAAVVTTWDGQARLHLAFTNGEGRNRIEQNHGKNITAVLSVTPAVLETRQGPGVLGVHVAARDGSVGAAALRNHRLAAGLTWSHPRMNFGVEGARAWGYAGRAARETQGAGLWAGGTLLQPWVGLVGRADILDMDLSREDTWRFQGTAGVYSDLLDHPDPRRTDRLRLYAAFQMNRASENAAPVPGAADAFDDSRLLLLLSTRGTFSAQ